MKGTNLGAWLEMAVQRRQAFARDPHRPRYHFLPPDNWTNDPNGVIEWGGRYHLFYQHNPHGPFHGTIHWGHAVSRDLVYWEDLPLALEPTPGGPDEDGCFSGCAVDNGGVPTLVYTGLAGNAQTQCIAESRDGLLTWEKYAGNPVLATPPEGVRPLDFRDPWVWREDGVWYMLLASGQLGGGGTVLLYRSPDLLRWAYLRPLLTGQVEETGEVWECPNFFRLGDKHVLVISVWPQRSVHAFIGGFMGGHFILETHRTLDADGSFYAPLTLEDTGGRRLIWGWLDEQRSGASQRAAGWAGVMSLPRVLSLNGGGLRTDFAPELRALRQDHVRAENLDLTEPINLGVQGPALELRFTFERGSASRSGIRLARSPDGAEGTSVYIDWLVGQLVIDRERSSLSEGVSKRAQSGFLNFTAETVEVHLYLDGSVLEVVAERLLTLSTRIYPSRVDSLGVQLFSEEGVSRLRLLEAWTLASIW